MCTMSIEITDVTSKYDTFFIQCCSIFKKNGRTLDQPIRLDFKSFQNSEV